MKFVAIALAVLVLAGAGVVAATGSLRFGSQDDVSGQASDTPVLVAIGDSFTSGAGVPPYENESCERSKVAYPELVANRLGMELRNVACAGATTQAVRTSFKSQQPQASQLEGADYVVGTLGGNDINTLQSIAAVASGGLSAFTARLPRMRDGLIASYAEIKAAAPNARVFAVTYPDIIPQSQAALTRCFGPMAAGIDLSALHAGAAALNNTIKEAASASGVEVIDPSQAFAGHEVCTEDPWVVAPDVAGGGHPTERGHQALADAVSRAIRP